jgi:CRISPR system Cascade subunit CasD
MDAFATVVLSLNPADDEPDLDRLAQALDCPARPLFLGRKPCLPSRRLFDGFVTAVTAYDALRKAASAADARHRAMWPADEGPQEGRNVDRIVELPDIRNWRSGLHGGSRRVVEGRVAPEGLAG